MERRSDFSLRYARCTLMVSANNSRILFYLDAFPQLKLLKSNRRAERRTSGSSLPPGATSGRFTEFFPSCGRKQFVHITYIFLKKESILDSCTQCLERFYCFPRYWSNVGVILPSVKLYMAKVNLIPDYRAI